MGSFFHKSLWLGLVATFLAFGGAVFSQDPEGLQKISERLWIKADTHFDKGKTMGHCEFQIWYPYSPEKAWEVLIDTNLWKKIHSEFTDARTLNENQYSILAHKKSETIKEVYEWIGEETFPSFDGRRKGKVWTSYALERFNLPWPLKDRWAVVKIKNDEANEDEGKYRYEYQMLIGNFKKLKGYWELFPVKNKPGWTEFRGEYDSDPGIHVPEFLAKKIFSASMKKNAEENLEWLDKLHGSPGSNL